MLWKLLLVLAFIASVLYTDVSAKSCKCCGENEVYTSCIKACPFKYCSVGQVLIACQQDQPCTGAGCVCKVGYARLRDGSEKCVPVDQCPQPKFTKT
ncbi:trypsin inhibitor like cysteine rich domain-containing protein [Phthorimaea operculella]|nr:trypsin inhibitor like cysteine rich domain-containing protein [Phthorimaea operculella]